MNSFIRTTLMVSLAAAAVFVLCAAAAYVVIRTGTFRDMNAAVSSLIVAGGITGLFLPLSAWLAARRPSLNRYSGYQLEELSLDESEVSDAISNWVYAKHRRRTEDEIRFLEDDDGRISCRVTVRTE